MARRKKKTRFGTLLHKEETLMATPRKQQEISKSYGGRRVGHDVYFLKKSHRGEKIVGLLGPKRGRGTPRSTWFVGLISPDSGKVSCSIAADLTSMPMSRGPPLQSATSPQGGSVFRNSPWRELMGDPSQTRAVFCQAGERRDA